MYNTLANKSYFESGISFKIKASPTTSNSNEDEVFFIVNVKELFNIDLNFPGIKGALNAAFMYSKQFVPVDTGMTKRSYTMHQIDNYSVKCFFDPNKIVGQKRNGVIVKDYYVKYIAEHASRFNWMQILIKNFYDELYKQMRSLQKKHPEGTDKSGSIAFSVFLIFKELFDNEYKAKKEEAKRLKEEEIAKKKAQKQTIKQKKKQIRLQNRAIKEVE